MDEPLVSIIIPVYNAEKYIDLTIQSAIRQTWQNKEIIIIDDGSTDNSNSIALKHKSNNILIIKQKNKGASTARNKGFANANGEYIQFLDADDYIPENFIETQMELLNSAEEVAVSNWGRFYNDDLSTITLNSNQIEKDLTFDQWIINYWKTASSMTCPGRILVSRLLIEKAGLWDEDLSLNDDFTFYTRVFSKCSLIRYNSNSVFYYRSNNNGLSSIKGDLAYESLYNSIIRSISIAQSKLTGIKELNTCYANLLQNFIYESYPLSPKLINEAKMLIDKFGGSNLKFHSGGKSRLAIYFFGWKLVKRFKYFLSIKKNK